jgi:hypothetical protein
MGFNIISVFVHVWCIWRRYVCNVEW